MVSSDSDSFRGDLKEPELPEARAESSLLINNHISHDAAQISEPRVQTSKITPLFDDDQDSPLS